MKEKERYFSPDTVVMEFRNENVLCASPDYALNPGNPFGDSTEENW